MEVLLYIIAGCTLGALVSLLIGRSHLKRNFISKELHEQTLLHSNEANERFHQEKAEHESSRAAILELIRESEQKLTRAEIERIYVGRESYDAIKGRLLQADQLLVQKEDSILRLNNELTGLQKKEEYLNEKLSTFQRELEQIHLHSQDQFKNMASSIMDEKRKAFLEINKAELNTIIEPLQERLKEFREKIEATRKEDIADMTSLKNEIGSLEKLSYQLSDDAKNLALALKSEVKMQGNWGEDRLNMILETEGLQKHIDFTREEVLRDDEQEKNRRPDLILKLPGGKHLVIDSKVSLTAYVGYFNAATPEEKMEMSKQHLRSVANHIEELSDKNYHLLSGLRSPDYVFMFMPVESALTLALNLNPDLFDLAIRKKIVLITPTTLVATLKIIKMVWQKEKQVKNVEEIFRQCGELYDKFVVFLEQIKGVENGLHAALKAHQEAMYSLTDGNRKGNTIIGRFEAIRKLEARTNRQIPENYTKEIDLLSDDPEIG